MSTAATIGGGIGTRLSHRGGLEHVVVGARRGGRQPGSGEDPQPVATPEDLVAQQPANRGGAEEEVLGGDEQEVGEREAAAPEEPAVGAVDRRLHGAYSEEDRQPG